MKLPRGIYRHCRQNTGLKDTPRVCMRKDIKYGGISAKPRGDEAFARNEALIRGSI